MPSEISSHLKSKAKTEKEKEVVKPTVINDSLMRQYLIQYNKDNKIFDRNDDPLWDLTHLSLSYKNIIGIDNLDGMTKLTKLQLDNNIICKIENLGELKNLTWLDLSFNMIPKIEGLEQLTKLTDLSLYSNQIQHIEGLDTLTQLNVFSFGKNAVRSYDDAVRYLKKLNNKLQVLNMEDNPYVYTGTSDRDYKFFTICMLRGLKYLDYKLITDVQRKQAQLKYEETVMEIEQQENNKEKEAEKSYDPIHEKAHITDTDDMLEKLLAKDKDALDYKQALGRKFDDYYGPFEEAVIEPRQKYQQGIKQLYNKKDNTIQYCERELRKEQLAAEKRCIEEIKRFQKYRKRAKAEMTERQVEEKVDEDEYGDMLKGELNQMETNLMDIEMCLKAVLLTATQQFKEKVNAINNDIRTKTDEFIQHVKELAETFNQDLKAYALEYQPQFVEFANENAENPEYQNNDEFDFKYEQFESRDIVLEKLERSGATWETELSAIEQNIKKAMNKEWDAKAQSVTEQQQMRNRQIIKEIIDTVKCFYD